MSGRAGRLVLCDPKLLLLSVGALLAMSLSSAVLVGLSVCLWLLLFVLSCRSCSCAVGDE